VEGPDNFTDMVKLPSTNQNSDLIPVSMDKIKGGPSQTSSKT
jgi:hypothetical protein